MMKTLEYELTPQDVETFLFALSVFQNYSFDGVPPVQQMINNKCCDRALDKLCTGDTNITPNELRIMSASLSLVSCILQGQIVADDNTKKLCSKYRFSVNELLPIFDGFVESNL